MGCGTCPESTACGDADGLGEKILVGMDNGSPIYMTPEELAKANTTEVDQDLMAAVRVNNLRWLGATTAFILGLVFAAIALIPAAQLAVNVLGGH